MFAGHERELESVLTPDERAFVQRRRREPGRATARLSRALLRLLLGDYLGVDPRELDIDRECPECGKPHGKPRLRGDRPLHVSVAHCSDLLVFAVTASAPVGVDVESLAGCSGVPSDELLAMVLAPAERACVERVAPGDRWRSFLRRWTYKEAALKQQGVGLTVPLHAVTVPDGECGGPVDFAGVGGALDEVWVRPLPVRDPHLAAIATVGQAAVSRVTEISLTLLPSARPSPRSR
ncbi:MAG TPA: 4'-phosphopantetheinyl transferase superfamily protein [Mycobacteriales bacterium]|nr:4'-phosphopantetheinyl transferase superfamily protein [Mycobacteriales bacterium]